jgi:DNA polymerase-3 subunit beta
VKIPAKLIADLIAKTTFAISLEESRYTLNGALMVLKPGSITMVATDGHRLAMVERDHKFEGFSAETRVLVPKKAMTEVQRLAAESGDDGQVEFAQDESHLFFQFGRRLLTSRKLTGQFPNYEAVLPREVTKVVVLERAELQDALRRVSQLADSRSHAVKFMLAKEGLEISASSPEYGEAKEIIEKEFKGDPIAIGFNAQYLLDFLAAATDGPINFELKDEQSAGQLRPVSDESTRYRYVVMPMRI